MITNSFPCDACNGLGWKPIPGRFPIACAACKGTLRLTWHRVASLLGETPQTIGSVLDVRSRPATAARVLQKVSELLTR